MDGEVLPLDGKRILLGITGGIAAYKSCTLVRLLVDAGASVHVCMTEAATRFVTPLTFEALSGHPVHTEIFSSRRDAATGAAAIAHTELGREMDAAVVAPATADFLGRLAGGLCDQLLLCALMASRMPVLLCPSMNVNMWESPLVQRNIAILQGLSRYRWVEPDEGWLACGVVGKGRLPEPDVILAHMVKLLRTQDMAGMRVLVSAGPTREWLDPVRFLSNPSSGQMGFALARAAWERGASVHLVAGPTDLPPPPGVRVTRIETTRELLQAMEEASQAADLVVMAAAPADYRPRTSYASKQKKSAEGMSLELVTNPDVIATLAARALRPVILGFAAETDDLLANAAAKVRRKALDFIFVNRVGPEAAGGGFGTPANAGTLLDAAGEPLCSFPLLPKRTLANAILDAILAAPCASPRVREPGS